MMANFQLWVGDNVDKLAGFQPEIIDLTISSPPYDKARNYEGYAWHHIKLIEQLFRVTKPGGVVVWVVADTTYKGSETGSSLRQALAFMDAGFNLHDTMIYAKNNPMPNDCGTRYRQAFEYMYVFSKGTPKTFNPITVPVASKSDTFRSFRVTSSGRGDLAEDRVAPKVRKLSNIWYYTVGSAVASQKIAFNHPALFPEKLAKDHILSWSNSGDTVLDPMCGSGTVGVVAVPLGRNFIGIDVSEEYIEQIARPRITWAIEDHAAQV
jgi:DNA modification methylase